MKYRPMTAAEFETRFNRIHDRLPTDHDPNQLIRSLAVMSRHEVHAELYRELDDTRRQAIADGAR